MRYIDRPNLPLQRPHTAYEVWLLSRIEKVHFYNSSGDPHYNPCPDRIEKDPPFGSIVHFVLILN